MTAINKLKCNKNKGFSLVEMIVVIAIMIVLLSMLVPYVVGYIEKAARMSAINTARVMVNGMEVSMIEHAQEGSIYLNKVYTSEYYDNGKALPCGFLTNYMLYYAQTNYNYDKSKHDYADFLIAKDILEAVRSGPKETKPALKFTKTDRPLGANCKEYCKDGGTGAIFAYAPAGGVYYAQVCTNGWLVTYEHGNYDAQKVKSDTAFASKSKLNEKK